MKLGEQDYGGRRSFSLLAFHPFSKLSPSPCLLLLLLLLSLTLLYHCFFCTLPSHTPSSPLLTLSLPSNHALYLHPPSLSSCPSGRIFVYDLPPRFNSHILSRCSSLLPWLSLCPALSSNGLGLPLPLPSWLGTSYWYSTNQFSHEVLFHARMLLHPCRTLTPDHAAAFYVPFYVGLDLGSYLWTDSSPEQRDKLSIQLVQWLKGQKYWKRKQGRDHFLTVGRITWDFRRSERVGWGSSFNNMPEVKEMLRLTIERSPWDDREMAVPYPTSFHPRSAGDILAWRQIVRATKRNTLFSFAGAARSQFPNDFRGMLMEQCARPNASCRIVDCSDSKCEHPLSTLELFLDSLFCLQPRGDSYTRRSIFDALLAGCIPVFFWRRTAYDQYEWHLPADEPSYSVFIPKEEVERGVQVEDILRALPKDRVQKMQETIAEILPSLIYAVPGARIEQFRDAFDVAVDGVLSRLMKEGTSYSLS